MPETAIDEHRDPRPGENQVRLEPPVSGQWREVHPIAQAGGVDEAAHGEFRHSVSAPIGSHARPNPSIGCPALGHGVHCDPASHATNQRPTAAGTAAFSKVETLFGASVPGAVSAGR